jgi:hypothetical protein
LQGGKPTGMVSEELVIDGHILVIAEELAHHPHRQHLAISQHWRESMLPDAALARTTRQRGQHLIHEAERSSSDALQVHGAPP